MAMDHRVQDFFSSPRLLPGLAVVLFLAVMLAFPAAAQTSSDTETQGTGTAGVPVQSDRGSTSSDQVTPKTDSNSATPNANSTAARPESKSAETQREPNPVTKKVGSAILIKIDKTNQKMTIFLGGVKKYEWPVSTGKGGYSTPSGTYTATSMNEIWYSKQWDNAPMPHSIFFIKDGHAIHGSNEVKNLGKPVSHGCVRISPDNAATLYAMVAKNGLENTQVVLTGVTPGGESKVVSRAGGKSRYGQAAPGWYPPGDNYYTQAAAQRGLFGRSFGGPYYNQAQGNYGPPTIYYGPRGY
jgi:lipoprotein-anchoring transpeptidase ErfK/SrfK